MNPHSEQIAIIGCGYIGTEAASIWSKKGYQVTATTRNPAKLEALSKVAQKGLILKGNDEEELTALITNHPIFLIAIGADSPDHYESAYLNTAQIFRHLALEMDLPRRLIYTSSSSVYGDHHGLWVDETSALHPKGEMAKILIETEKTYLSLSELGWQVSILRLAEIYGPGRELSKRVRQLKSHTLPGDGTNYTNMIHKVDCAASIDYALRHDLDGIFNVSDDEHTPRKQLYDQIADKFHLPKVKWDPSLTPMHNGNKRVSNHKLKAEGFVFRYPTHVLD